VNLRELGIGTALGLLPALGGAQQDVRVELEGGFAYQTRNTCAIPADSNKFSYRDLMGRGPFSYARITALVNQDRNSGYRIVIAPLNISGVGTLPNRVKFNGVNFDPGVPTSGRYIFNNYRLTWWHKWRPVDGIDLRTGWTLFVRDADVSLSQGSKSASFYNLGPVPLFYLEADRALTNRLKAEFVFDGLVAPEGGAIDTSLALAYAINSRSTLKLKGRYLDGGSGSGSAYTYATFNYVSLCLESRL
jgi:hypothetical protein